MKSAAKAAKSKSANVRASKKPTGANRRRYERLPLAVPVFVRGTDPQGNKFLEFATALDISAGGALLAIKRHLPAGSSISLEIPCAPIPSSFAPPKQSRNLDAKLVRVAASEQYHLLGLQFARPLSMEPATNRRKAKSKKTTTKL